MPKSDEEFLARFPPGSPEEQYYATLLRIVRSISFPMTEAAGFALLRLLDVDWMVNSPKPNSSP
ncbi:hypothetical protein D7X96_31340 [Corallococcus interemptor]|uniref:Uncharacterized protein n=1 Tax=Corallococcus interemptor TaxID=2316720 RepID=A0A3A8Q095_9BACT|nr:hypothetical protein [Corallococcus interemptor]RKH61568.1 hypothetical protein D7X96_31340 [Corallococcus interemptor]